MVKAGIASALALTLLVPTFNALNLSYVENVTPPPWMPPPKDPPNITPPTNFSPPPDFEPPEGYEGEVPPGACPPPVERVLEESKRDEAIPGPQPSWIHVVAWSVPEGAIAMKGYVNFTDWQAQSVSATLDGPSGFEDWSSEANAPAGLFVQPVARTSLTYSSFEGDNPRPVPAGDYTLTLRASFPISGRVTTVFGVGLACGGMMSG